MKFIAFLALLAGLSPILLRAEAAHGYELKSIADLGHSTFIASICNQKSQAEHWYPAGSYIGDYKILKIDGDKNCIEIQKGSSPPELVYLDSPGWADKDYKLDMNYILSDRNPMRERPVVPPELVRERDSLSEAELEKYKKWFLSYGWDFQGVEFNQKIGRTIFKFKNIYADIKMQEFNAKVDDLKATLTPEQLRQYQAIYEPAAPLQMPAAAGEAAALDRERSAFQSGLSDAQKTLLHKLTDAPKQSGQIILPDGQILVQRG